MKQNLIKSLISAGLFAGMLVFSSCHSGYSLSSFTGDRIKVTSELDAVPDSKATAILIQYQATVDSIMSPVIGESVRFMDKYRPESELSNLVADVLRLSTVEYIGRPADVGITNMGGLRSSLPKGKITYGNIYEITPFENTLCIVTMRGRLLKQLFNDIAKAHGEGLSGARLVITKEGALVSATVGDKEIDDNQDYKVATLDYLSEGNDHMNSFKEATDKVIPEGATVRQLFLNYVEAQSKAGKKVDSKLEGRITVKQ